MSGREKYIIAHFFCGILFQWILILRLALDVIEDLRLADVSADGEKKSML